MKAKYGERLRKIRDEAHLTQAELAEKLDLASSTISKWETNQQPIGKESITRLANFFHVSTDYLLGVADDTGTLPHKEEACPMESIFTDTELGKRIRERRNELRITQAELSRLTGLSQNSIINYEAGHRRPNLKNAYKLCEALQISLYSLTGLKNPCDLASDTSGYTDEPEIAASSAIETGATTMPPSNYDPFIDIPVLEFPACAGGGNGYDRSQIYSIAGTFPVEKSALLGHSWQSEGAFVVIVQGDSMLPRISEGDRVVFVRGENVADGDIVIAWWRDRLYVRGFFTNANGIELRPLNKRYEPIHIEKGDERLELIGRVVARIPPTESIGGMAF